MVKGDWNQGVIDEMRMFPNGAHDDRIDGLSRAYSQLIDSIFSYDNV
jgi:predicted phage terminase large subunit-like protein